MKSTLFMILTAVCTISHPLCIRAEQETLTIAEFRKLCQETHAVYSSVVELPGESTGFYRNSYEAACKKIERSETGVEESSHGPGYYSLESGILYMDLPEEYEFSYAFQIRDGRQETTVPGGMIEAEYRVVPVPDSSSPAEQYQYIKHQEPGATPVYDLPQDYDWGAHQKEPLLVSRVITARSLADGTETSWESRRLFVTDLEQPQPTVSALKAGQSHVVQRGDSLWKIAGQYYGNAENWTRIYLANFHEISNPDRIFPGQTLQIPAEL